MYAWRSKAAGWNGDRREVMEVSEVEWGEESIADKDVTRGGWELDARFEEAWDDVEVTEGCWGYCWGSEGEDDSWVSEGGCENEVGDEVEISEVGWE